MVLEELSTEARRETRVPDHREDAASWSLKNYRLRLGYFKRRVFFSSARLMVLEELSTEACQTIWKLV